MEDEHERDRRDHGAEAAEDRLRALRALPVGPEPGEARQQGEHAEAPRSRLSRGEPAGGDEPKAGREVGHPSCGERSGVSGLEGAAVIDGEECGDGPGEDKRHPCEHGQAESGGEARVRHRAILAPNLLLPATVSAEKILWPAAMCRAPGDRTVLS